MLIHYNKFRTKNPYLNQCGHIKYQLTFNEIKVKMRAFNNVNSQMLFLEEQLAFPTPITSYLFLGSKDTLNHHHFLSTITHVISVMKAPPLLPANKKQLIIPIEDSKEENIVDYFTAVCELIHKIKCSEEGEKIFIHCEKGMSRSASFVIAWLLYDKHLQGHKVSFQETLDWLVRRRSLVAPNDGFVTQLKRFAEHLNLILEKKQDKATQPNLGY